MTNEHPQESDEEGEPPLKPDDIQAGLITPVEGGYAWGGMLGWLCGGGGVCWGGHAGGEVHWPLSLLAESLIHVLLSTQSGDSERSHFHSGWTGDSRDDPTPVSQATCHHVLHRAQFIVLYTMYMSCIGLSSWYDYIIVQKLIFCGLCLFLCRKKKIEEAMEQG